MVIQRSYSHLLLPGLRRFRLLMAIGPRSFRPAPAADLFLKLSHYIRTIAFLHTAH